MRCWCECSSIARDFIKDVHYSSNTFNWFGFFSLLFVSLRVCCCCHFVSSSTGIHWIRLPSSHRPSMHIECSYVYLWIMSIMNGFVANKCQTQETPADIQTPLTKYTIVCKRKESDFMHPLYIMQSNLQFSTYAALWSILTSVAPLIFAMIPSTEN